MYSVSYFLFHNCLFGYSEISTWNLNKIRVIFKNSTLGTCGTVKIEEENQKNFQRLGSLN